MEKKRKRMDNHPTLSSLPLSRLVPNIITLLALCTGLFAIKCAWLERWEMAVVLILVASVLDNMDGRLARMLNASSNFGAQLDSLVDFLNFSVAPALILYMWKTHEIRGMGWAVTLFFIICGAIRLARFNVSQEEDRKSPLQSYFFMGVAAPPAALLSLVPLMLTFMFADNFEVPPFKITTQGTIIYVAIIALLMVSRIPTYSFKKINVARELVPLILAFVGFVLIGVIIEPWIVLPILGVFYFILMPMSYWQYQKMRRELDRI